MKKFKLLTSAALLALSLNNPAHAWHLGDEPPPHPYDYLIHAGAAAGMAYGGYKLCQKYTNWNKAECRIASTAASFLVVGVAKELSDKNFMMDDLAASGAGSAIGLALTFEF